MPTPKTVIYQTLNISIVCVKYSQARCNSLVRDSETIVSKEPSIASKSKCQLQAYTSKLR